MAEGTESNGGDDPDQGQAERPLSWRQQWKLQRQQEDPLAARMREALQPRERRIGPPPRRESGAVGRWLKRGKLWDDVFTRTLSGVLTVAIIYVVGVAAGLFRPDQKAWAAIVFIGGFMVAGAVVNVAPVRYLEKQGVRWLIFWGLVAIGICVASLLYLPFAPEPDPNACDPLLLTC